MYVILNFVAPVVEETTQCSGEVKIRIISKLTRSQTAIPQWPKIIF